MRVVVFRAIVEEPGVYVTARRGLAICLMNSSAKFCRHGKVMEKFWEYVRREYDGELTAMKAHLIDEFYVDWDGSLDPHA